MSSVNLGSIAWIHHAHEELLKIIWCQPFCEKIVKAQGDPLWGAELLRQKTRGEDTL